MAMLDTDVATAEAGGDVSPDSFSNDPARNTRARTPGGFDPSVDGGVNAARQARVSGAAAMDEAGRSEFGSELNAAKDYAKDVAGRAKEQGRAMFDEQKESAAGTVHSAANAFRNTAQQLQGEGRTETGRYVEMFADQLQSLGHRLHNENLDGLIREVEDFGRRSPGTLLAGSVIAGFVLTRFLKSSAEHRHDSDRSYRERDDRSSYASDRSSSASPTSREDDGALLRRQPYASVNAEPNVSDIGSDADTSGSVMEGSDVGSLAGVTTALSPIATGNAAFKEGERHDNR
jgi:hypothetical protein